MPSKYDPETRHECIRSCRARWSSRPVIGVSDSSDRRPQPRQRQCFAEMYCSVLRSAVRVVDGAVDPVTLAGAQCSGLADRGLHEPGLTLAVFIRLLRQR
jgi:hypothetical protein